MIRVMIITTIIMTIIVVYCINILLMRAIKSKYCLEGVAAVDRRGAVPPEEVPDLAGVVSYVTLCYITVLLLYYIMAYQYSIVYYIISY